MTNPSKLSRRETNSASHANSKAFALNSDDTLVIFIIENLRCQIFSSGKLGNLLLHLQDSSRESHPAGEAVCFDKMIDLSKRIATTYMLL